MQLGERFHAGVARADEDVAELLSGGWVGRGALELLEDAVAECDRVGEPLEPVRVLAEAGHVDHARHGTERDDEPLVSDLERACERVGVDDAPLGVSR